jgi:hypothetical protein
MMGAWAGPFIAAALLLVVAGALKAFDPATTAGALRRAGVPAPSAAVRAGGVVEALIGAVAIATGDPVAALLVAASYAVFTAFVVVALARGIPVGSCGCFGKADTPPSIVHVVVNAGAVVTAVAVALGPGGGIGEVLADQPLLGLPFLALVGAATYAAFLALTLIPQLHALETRRPEIRGSRS